MADIDVVKRGSHVWLWIILAVVVALILWYVLAGARVAPAQTGMRIDHGGQALQVTGDYLQHV